MDSPHEVERSKSYMRITIRAEHHHAAACPARMRLPVKESFHITKASNPIVCEIAYLVVYPPMSELDWAGPNEVNRPSAWLIITLVVCQSRASTK